MQATVNSKEIFVDKDEGFTTFFITCMTAIIAFVAIGSVPVAALMAMLFGA
jgi:hypothetical protein